MLRRLSSREGLERSDIAGVVCDLGIEDGAFAKVEQSLVQNSIDTIHLDCAAKYRPLLHRGSHGHTPRPWLNFVTAHCSQIVAAKAAMAKQKFGL